MNGTDLISMMKMEHKPSEKNMRALQNIVADNPWFAIGQQLLAQEIQKFDNQNFENFLYKAAIYTINREILYKKLYSGDQKNTIEQQQDVNIEPQIFTNEILQTENVETQNIPDENQQEENVETQSVTDEIQQTENVDTQSVTDENQQAENIETQSVTNEIQQAENIETQSVTDETQQEENVETQNITDETQQEENVETQNITNETQQEKNIENIAPELGNEKEEKPVFDYPVADYFASQPVTENESNEDIIDKFLASPQKISAAHERSDGEIAENLTTEPIINDDFVTETLAKIYAEQGYFSKAIEVYEKLSLQNSKKSIYFATLIEGLKKKIKN